MKLLNGIKAVHRNNNACMEICLKVTDKYCLKMKVIRNRMEEYGEKEEKYSAS